MALGFKQGLRVGVGLAAVLQLLLVGLLFGVLLGEALGFNFEVFGSFFFLGCLGVWGGLGFRG